MPDLFSPEVLAAYVVTAVLTLISLFIIYLIVGKLLYKPLKKFVDERTEQINKDLDSAAEKLKDADAKLAQSKESVANAKKEAMQLLAETNEKAGREAKSIVDEAKDTAKKIAARSEDDIARQKLKMLNDVREEVSGLSIAIASKLIGEALDRDARKLRVDQLIEERFAEEVSKLPAPNGTEVE